MLSFRTRRNPSVGEPVCRVSDVAREGLGGF
jgi:hypothetical protein